MEKTILVFDPGESTGWVYRTDSGLIVGGTCKMNHLEVARKFEEYAPDIVVFERFNLYPGMAKSLSWNTFYPCEVIGVIRYICIRESIPYIEQAPGIKKYAGGLQADWHDLRNRCEVTEHTKDAYLHLRYFERVGLKKFKGR